MTHTASHIIISSSIGGDSATRTTGSGVDEIQITYTPAENLSPEQVGREVAKRLKWIESLTHADAADT